MNNETILVATDFSPDAALALEQARAHALVKKGRILLVHVLQIPSRGEGEGMLHHGANPDETVALTRKLKSIADAVDDVDCQSRLLHGDPATEILRVAAEEKVAMIVMGTQGRSGVARLLLGSVAEQVVRGATCSVLVVKRPREV